MDLRPETLIQCPRAFTYPILNVSKAEVSRRVAEAIVNVNYQYRAVFKKKKNLELVPAMPCNGPHF